MKLQISWKRLSLSLLLITIALGSYLSYRVFSSPSGQIGSIEGGGFCGGTYTIYNNTVDNKLYAMNCSTGVNDVASQTDFGATFNSIRALMTYGGEIDIRQGRFNAVTSSIFSASSQVGGFVDCGITVKGTGGQEQLGAAVITNGTIIVAKTNSMTVFESYSNPVYNSSPTLIGCTLQDLTCDLGTTNGVTCFNFSMTDSRADNRFINLAVNGPLATGNTTGIILNGDEDTDLIGYKGGYTTTDIQWRAPLGNIQIMNAAVTNILGQAQSWTIIGGTVSMVKLIGQSGTTGQQGIVFDGVYEGNAVGPGRILLNGFTLGSLQITGGFWTTQTGQPFIVGSGTVSAYNICGTTWNFGTGGVWYSGSPTVGNANDCSNSNHVAINNATPTGFPFVVNGNGNF